MTHKTEIQGSNFKALVVSWSATGNTATVARTIEETLEKAQVDSKLLKIAEAGNEDFYSSRGMVRNW